MSKASDKHKQRTSFVYNQRYRPVQGVRRWPATVLEATTFAGLDLHTQMTQRPAEGMRDFEELPT